MFCSQRSTRRLRILSAAVAAALGPAASMALGAGANPYTGGGTGTAATPVTGNFSTGFPTTPPTAGGSATLELDFSNSGTNAYTATDDLTGALSLNILQFGTDSTSGGGLATVAAGSGNSLNFVTNGATTPTITQNGSSAFTVSAPLAATNLLTLGIGGSAASSSAGLVTFSGATTNTGGLTVSGGNYTFTGVVSGAGAINVSGGTLSFLNTANTFTGTAVNVSGGNFVIQSGGSFGTAPGASGTGNPATRTLTLTNGGEFTINTSYDLNVTNSTYPIISIGTGGGVLNQAAGATLILNDAGEFIGASGAGVTKTGAGQITFSSQTYSFSGPFIINQGTVQVDAASTLGTATVVSVAPVTTGITGTAGAVLNVDNGTTLARPIQLAGTGIASAGGLINGTSGNTSNITGGITLTASASVGGAGSLNISATGVNDGGGAYSLTKVGAGVVTLGAADAYTGGTTVSAGTLSFLTTSALPGYPLATGGVTVASGATLAFGVGGAGSFSNADIANYLSGSNGITFSSTSSLGYDTTNASAGAYSASSLPNGTMGLTKLGAGILYVPAAASYTGNTTVYGGVLSATDGTGLPTASLLNLDGIVAGGGTFSPTSGSFTRAVGSAAGQVELTGGISGFSAVGTPTTINLGGAGATITWGGATFNPSALLLNDVAATSTLSFQNGINLAGAVRTVTVNATAAGTAATLAGALSSTNGGINKTGAGTLYVTNPSNSYTGLSESSAGTLSFAGSGALPASSAIGLNTGTVQLLNDGLASNATISQGNNVNIIVSSTNASTISVGNNGSSNTGNTIAFGLLNNQYNSQNTGYVNFNGANGYQMSFTGLALPNGSGADTKLFPNTPIAINGPVTNGGTGSSTNFDSLYFLGTSAGNVITGAISDAPNKNVAIGNYTRLLVEGANTLTLTGASTYTGGTFVGNNAVNTGTLIVNGSIGGTFVTVQGGGTLGGMGTIGDGTATLQNTQGSVVVAGGSTAAAQGTINLVDNKIGALTIQGNSFATAAAQSLTLGGTAAGTPSIIDLETNGTINDEITLNGGNSNKLSLQAGGAVINIVPIGSATLGAGTYALLNFATGSAITGAFTLGSVPLTSGETASLSAVTSTSTVENLIVSSGNTAGAINAYWTGSTSAVWNAGAGGTTGTNFTSDQAGTTGIGVPDSGTNVFFAASNATTANLTITLGQGFTINSLSFIGAAPTATNAVTIGGTAPLTINAAAMFSDQSSNAYAAGTGIVVQAGVNATETISAPLVLGASQNWINNATGSTAGALTASGGVSGTGNLSLYANGTGNINVSGNAINTAGTITNAGSGTTPGIYGTLGTVTPLALGNIYATLGSNVTGVFQNSATSDLVLGGNNSTYTGGITISAGTLEISDYASGVSTALGAATDVINLGTTSAPATLDFNSRLSSVMAGATAVNGAATVAGLITVGGSGLDVISATDYGATFSGAVTLKNNLTVALPNSGGSSVTFTGGITGTGNITVSSETSSGSNVANFTTNPINFAGTITFNNAAVNGGTAGTGTGTNTITGGVGSNVTGIIQASSHNPLTISGNAITVNSAGTTLTQSGTALFTVSGGVNGTGALVLNNNNAGSAGLTVSTSIVNNVGTITNSGTGSAGTTISAVVGTNVTGVTQNSSTSGLTLSAANVYAGLTTISAGYVQLTNAAGASTGPISIASGGELLLAAGSATYPNSVSGAGYVEDFNGSAVTTVLTGAVNYTGNTYFRAASTINFAPSSPSTLSGVIGSTTGGYSTIATVSTGSIIKSGSSALTLSGNNLYTGSTTITGGSLLVNGTHGTGATLAGNYSIASPATLGGTGTINLASGDSVSVAAGGYLSPGLGSAPGTLTITAPSTTASAIVSLASGSNFGVFLTHTAASELIVDSGAINLTGANLVLNQDGSLKGGETFTIIDPAGPSSIIGTFAGGTSGISDGIGYTLAYNTGSSPETVSLTVNSVPEPASAGLALLAGAGLLARRRRRRA